MFWGLTCFLGIHMKAAGMSPGIRTVTFRPCFLCSSEQNLTWFFLQCSKICSDSPALLTDTCQSRIIFRLQTKGHPARCLLIDNEYINFHLSASHNLLPGRKGGVSDFLCEILPLSWENLPYQPVLCISFCSFGSLVLVLATVKISLSCHTTLSVCQNGLGNNLITFDYSIFSGRKMLCMDSNNTCWSHCCTVLLYKPELNSVQMKCSVKQVLISPLKTCSLHSVTCNTLLRPGEVPGRVYFYISLILREQ